MEKINSIILLTMVSLFFSQVGFAITDYNDGGTYDIITPTTKEIQLDYETPGAGTKVNVLPAGSAYGVYGYEDSQINLAGGTLNYLSVWDNSRLELTSGVVFENLYAFGSGQGVISGGTVGNFLTLYDTRRIIWSGGQIGGDLELGAYSELIIDGSDFAIDGNPVDVGEVITDEEFFSQLNGNLTGKLANGDIINNQFKITGKASMIFIPEPATIALLGLGGLALIRRNAPN